MCCRLLGDGRVRLNASSAMSSSDYSQYADVPPSDAEMTASEQAADAVYVYPGARELAVFHDWYLQYHGYLASVVCVFGIVANTLNIIVLTRPNMISSTNCILTGLATLPW